MSVDVNSVRRLLSADEPDYRALENMGAAVLPALARIIAGPDEYLAAAAAAAAGRIRDPRAATLVAQAARSSSADVRAAAAGAAHSQDGPEVNRALLALLGDADEGVRKFAIKAAVSRPRDQAVLARVRTIQTRDTAPDNRALAARALRFASGRRTA